MMQSTDTNDGIHGQDHEHHNVELTVNHAGTDGTNNNNNDNSESTSNAEAQSLLIPTGHPSQDDSGSTKRRVKRSSADGSGGSSSMLASGAKRKSRTSDTTKSRSEENPRDRVIKYAALFLLVAQMVGLVLLMRYSRTQHDDTQPLYLASTAVFLMEVMKLVICVGVIAVQTKSGVLHELYTHTIGSPLELLKLTVPSLLYTVQNNLLYLALTNLDAATYQVCYQLKILTTALFSALLLQRKFSTMKWLSLVVLTIGVAIVQLSGSGDQHSEQDSKAATDAVDDTNGTAAAHTRWVGLVAVLCAACTSGFSGVYFEKILKGSRTSLWIRNVQMGLSSIVIAYLTVYVKDAEAIRTQGFWGGYNTLVWTVVTVQAVGGLIVATVVKYADNVLKVFATSFSIVVSCIVSAFLFDFHPSVSFLVGASLVVTATVMYSSPETRTRKTRRRPVLPIHHHNNTATTKSRV
jgi:UDP-sugar transporter A1/2/3